MVRIAALVLLLANAVYFAWSQGLLVAYGFAPEAVSEPERLQQQVHPEMVLVLPPGTADAPVAVASAAPAPTECLTAGVLDAARGGALTKALAALPADAWTLAEVVEPGRWLVYMGRYANTDVLDRKKAELRGMRVKFEAPPSSLEPGLSLGAASSEAAAHKILADAAQRGVHTARVVLDRPEVRGLQLRLPAVDAAMKAQLDGLKPALGGKALRACS
jgi:hypothetical protein